MKKIIKRGLPLNLNYTVIDKKYVPLSEGIGCTCDNCGKLIANIATVKSDLGTFNIGFDCLENILINNALLSSNDIADYETVKKMIPKVIRFSKYIKEVLGNNPHITGINFETKTYDTDWITFYWLLNNDVKGRNNASIKIKGMDFDFLVSTLKNIFPKLLIQIIEA